VVGTVLVLTERLIAPFTGRTCVYYELKVVERGRSETQLIHEQRGVRFMLLDRSARAIVDPLHAKLAVDVVRTTSGSFNPATAAESALLQRYHKRSRGWIFDKELRYEETVIGVGETIAVLGTGVREPDPEAEPIGYRGEQPTRLVISGSPRFPILISDNPSTTT